MKVYNIAGIRLAFSYQFDEYFEDNLEHYLDKEAEEADYTIEVRLEDSIAPSSLPVKSTYRNRTFYQDGSLESMCVFDKEKNVRMRIDHTSDFKTHTIYLKKGDPAKNAEDEYVVAGMMFLKVALKEGRLSLHGAAVDYLGEALVFAGPSGTGKSTHRKLWEEHFPVTTINDDKPLLFEENGTLYVAGSPFSGKNRLNQNIVRPLKAIAFLTQARADKVRPLTNEEKTAEIMRNVYRPGEIELWDKFFPLLNTMLESTHMVRLDATKDKSACLTLHNYLYEEESR